MKSKSKNESVLRKTVYVKEETPLAKGISLQQQRLDSDFPEGEVCCCCSPSPGEVGGSETGQDRLSLGARSLAITLIPLEGQQEPDSRSKEPSLFFSSLDPLWVPGSDAPVAVHGCLSFITAQSAKSSNPSRRSRNRGGWASCHLAISTSGMRAPVAVNGMPSPVDGSPSSHPPAFPAHRRK